MASAECMEGPRAPTPQKCSAGCSVYRQCVLDRCAATHHGVSNSNPIIVLLQTEVGFVNKRSVVPFRCQCPPFISPLTAQMRMVSSQCNRLRWGLGHNWRSPENKQTRAYTFKNPMGSGTRGRPPTRWIDDVENDLKTLNIKNWQRVAVYRWNWRKRAVEVAKICNRLLRL
ncbi:endonuclease-reverse transcriptase [Trichonephila clavipes]|nr:endonuclease-reverse transcriptase [Trichonephila clavipes]